jgi:hypothetical protein
MIFVRIVGNSLRYALQMSGVLKMPMGMHGMMLIWILREITGKNTNLVGPRVGPSGHWLPRPVFSTNSESVQYLMSTKITGKK